MDISTMAGQLEETGPPPPTLTGPLVLPAPQAFSSIGQLYHGIERGLRGLVDRYGEGQVFVGSPNAQARTLRSMNSIESMIEICRDHAANA